jgi:glycosyltransferase involved in cell wall biosynthesis
MRFCLVSTQEHWGGGEALLVSVGSQLLRLGHSVSCIVRHGGVVERHIAEAGATVLHATQKRGSNLSDWLAIRHALRHWSPDVVILNDSHAVPLIGSAAWFCRTPRPLRLAMKHTIFRLHSPLKYRLLSDKLICVSQAALETVLQGGLPRQHAVVIHGGCQPVTSDPSARSAVRAEFAIAPEQFLITAVGSLLDCKGHRELIAAVEQLSTSHPQIVVLIAGEGSERGNLQQQIAASGLASRVHLLGYRTDAQRLLDAADLVVHPSHAEGLSLVLIQAQMLGKPIVATAVGGTKEVLAVDSPLCSCWIAQPQDPTSLASSIAAAHSALAQPTAELQHKLANTAERMREKFTVQATTRELVELATHLLTAATVPQPGLG